MTNMENEVCLKGRGDTASCCQRFLYILQAEWSLSRFLFATVEPAEDEMLTSPNLCGKCRPVNCHPLSICIRKASRLENWERVVTILLLICNKWKPLLSDQCMLACSVRILMTAIASAVKVSRSVKHGLPGWSSIGECVPQSKGCKRANRHPF